MAGASQLHLPTGYPIPVETDDQLLTLSTNLDVGAQVLVYHLHKI